MTLQRFDRLTDDGYRGFEGKRTFFRRLPDRARGIFQCPDQAIQLLGQAGYLHDIAFGGE